jgi:hypothetical protein
MTTGAAVASRAAARAVVRVAVATVRRVGIAVPAVAVARLPVVSVVFVIPFESIPVEAVVRFGEVVPVAFSAAGFATSTAGPPSAAAAASSNTATAAASASGAIWQQFVARGVCFVEWAGAVRVAVW